MLCFIKLSPAVRLRSLAFTELKHSESMIREMSRCFTVLVPAAVKHDIGHIISFLCVLW